MKEFIQVAWKFYPLNSSGRLTPRELISAHNMWLLWVPIGCCCNIGNPLQIYLEGLVQDCSNSSANALELLQSYTKPSILNANPAKSQMSMTVFVNWSNIIIPSVAVMLPHRGHISKLLDNFNGCYRQMRIWEIWNLRCKFSIGFFML